MLVYAQAGELSTEQVALGRLMAEVEEALRPSLGGRPAPRSRSGSCPRSRGDPRQLRRVLQNLVGNAVKFRGDAPLRVEVSALRDSQEWVVTVRDNGTGVDPDQASRIFGMFSRADTATPGAGIGLAGCRRIVEAHGGRIWARGARTAAARSASPCRSDELPW